MRSFLKHILFFFVKLIAPLFFKKEFLKGKHFEPSQAGWGWVTRALLRQKILGFNRTVPWPIHLTTTLGNWRNIEFHVDDLNNFQSPGCYFQNFRAKIVIGKGSYIAPNVGLITTNHDLEDLNKHAEGKDIILGEKCWIGMNAVVLPGVRLGNQTIVGAGSVVTKSFPEGHVVVAGNPAKVIKTLTQTRT